MTVAKGVSHARDAVLAEANAMLESNRYAEAVPLLQRHVERFPADRDADYLLGIAAYGSNDDELARAAFERCVRANPDNPHARYALDSITRRQRGSGAAPGGVREASTRERIAAASQRFTPRARLQALVLGVLLVLAVAVAAVVLSDPNPAPARFGAIQVGRSPDGVAVSHSIVWVASRDGILTRIEPDGSSKQIPLGIGKHLDNVAAGGGSVWVTGETEGKVARIDERSARVVDRITVGGKPKGLAVGGGAVWVANCRDGTVIRIALDSGMVQSEIPVGGRPRSVAVAAGRVYVAVRPSYSGCGGRAPGAVGHVAVLDVSEGQAARTLVKVGDPSDVALTKEGLWIADRSRDRVLRVDPITGDIEGHALPVAGDLTAIAANHRGVWTLSRDAATGVGTVTRIDPGTLKQTTSPIHVSGNPQEIALKSGRLWITQRDADTVTAITAGEVPE